jgi:putative FmdB family regulatory protein
MLEFACRSCGHRFEELVRRGESAVCPECEGSRLERQVSTFGVTHTSNGGEPCERLGSEACPAPVSGCGACGDPNGPGFRS